MKKYQTLTCGLLSSLLITACDGGLNVPTSPAATLPSDSINLRMPKSLQAADDFAAAPADTASEHASVNDGATDAEDNRESVRETMGDVSEIAGVLDAAATGASTQALYLGADLIYERVEFAEEILDDIDDIWDAIMAYCTSSSANDTCEIPGNTLVDDDGEVIDDATIVYQAYPDTSYAHSISRTTEPEGNEFEQIQWNDDRSRISMTYSGNWLESDGTAEHQSQLIYAEADDGIRVSLRDEFVTDNSSFTDLQQLHAMNDELNGIEIITEFNWREGDDNGKWQSHAVVNDQGGKLGTTASFADDPVIWHTRETFDENGDLTSSEYCEQTNGIDCSDSANWLKADFDFASAAELDIEDADYDLHEAYLQACEEMEVDDDACGFSETEMVIIDGAYDLFDNTDDVIVYLCIETGEDELVCRSEDNDTSNQFDSENENFTETDSDSGGLDAALADILFANPELEAGEPEDFELTDSIEIDWLNAIELIDADYECDSSESVVTDSDEREFNEHGSDENDIATEAYCIDAEHDVDEEDDKEVDVHVEEEGEEEDEDSATETE